MMHCSKRLFRFATPLALMLTSGVVVAQQAPVSGKQVPAEAAPTSDVPKLSPDGAPSATEATDTSVPTSNTSAETAISPPPAAPVAALPPMEPLTPEPVMPAPEAQPPAPPPTIFQSKLAIGKEGWLQVGAVLQGWYDLQWNSGIGPRNTKSTFRVRRAEIKLAGDIVHDVASFLVSFDPSSTLKFSQSTATVSGTTINTYSPPANTGILKLFWVTLKSPYLEASIGQFKHPISYEGQTSSAELLFAERAYSSRYFGDIYDMGLRLEKKFDTFKYQVFLLNGPGQNQIDTNKQKDLVVRLEATPITGLVLTTAGLTSIGQRSAQPTTKDRVEVAGKLDKFGLLVQGELLWGISGATGNDAQGRALERTKAAGRYAAVGYTFAKKLQPIVRLGYLNTDKTVTRGVASSYALYTPFGVATDEVRSYEAGLNYYLQGNELKLQACYGYYDFDDIPALQEFTVVAQASF
jgi:hypothetical protein